jgi:hypothetical protein
MVAQEDGGVADRVPGPGPEASGETATAGAGGRTDADGPEGKAVARPRLSPAAERALAEAGERRRRTQSATAGGAATPASSPPATGGGGGGGAREIGGRDGLEPTRYGDWEVNGVATDF